MALGTFVQFTKEESKYGNDDLMEGVVVSVGELVKLPIKKGDKILVSTVKKVQNIQDGKTFYYVGEAQIVDKL